MANKVKSPWVMFRSLLGIYIALGSFFAWMIAIVLFYFGSNLTKSIILLLLGYQFFFAKKNELYIRFLKSLRPYDYFDRAELIVEEPLKESKSLFCYHPHGILGFGFTMSAAFNDIIYNSLHCASRGMLILPISGIFTRWIGIVGVDNKNFQDYMKNGKNIKFVPGGFEEATLTHCEKERVFLKDRKGFIKYAIKFGYTLYPVYTFNENKIYYTINILEGFRLWLNKFKIPGTLFYGDYFILPRHNLEIVTVVGKGIELPVIENPSNEQIDKYHELYMTKLKELFDKYKDRFGQTSDLEML